MTKDRAEPPVLSLDLDAPPREEPSHPTRASVLYDWSGKSIWWLPTLGLFLFVAIELAALVHPQVLFSDPGVGRHLRTAEVILATHQVPRSDPLSFTAAGKPWIDYEWAFEATLGELNRAGGLGLICAFAVSLFAATVLGVYRTVLQAGVSVTVLVLVTGLAFLTLHLHFSARPVLFTYLFMAVLVEVWRRREFPRTRDWILLPVIFAAWANLHAGWAAGLAFLALSIAGRVADRITRRVNGDEGAVIPWLGLLALCAFATSFNPWGWELHRHIFEVTTSYKSVGLLNESAGPSFSQLNMAALTILVLLIVFFGTRVVRRSPLWRWEIILPIFFFLYEGLQAQRHVILLMIVAAVPLARDLEVLLHGKWWPLLRERLGEFQSRQRHAGGDAWLCLFMALVLAPVFAWFPLTRHVAVGQSVTPRLLAFIREHPDRFVRPLVTTANAGPLLWNLRPGFRVSFDDRFDLYGDSTAFAFNDLYRGAPGWRATLERGRYDSAILENYQPLGQLLALLPGWKMAYRDKSSVVFWATRSSSAASPGQTPAPPP